MVGRDDDAAAAAAGYRHQLREPGVERRESVGNRSAGDAEFVRQAVELRPIGVDVAARCVALQKRREDAEHLFQGFAPVAPRTTGQGDVEIRVHDRLRAHHMAGQGQDATGTQ